jgi:hypothetical protein
MIMAKVKKVVREGIKAMQEDVARWMPTRKEWPAVGDRVRLIGATPWAGELGTVTELRPMSVLTEDGPRPVVRLDSGRFCYITQQDQWEPAP